MAALPPLRNIEAVQAEHGGQPVIVLHDPEAYAEEQVALTGAAFFIAAHLDGKNEVIDIQARFARQFREGVVTGEQILEVVRFLDEQGFLFSKEFERRRQRIDDAFRSASARPAALAGKSYPADPEELKTFLDHVLTPPETPLPSGDPGGPALPGLIVPHIDFQRGGACYGAGYRALAARSAPRTAVVFGVAHASAPVPFILTRKAFDTPLGILETDTGVIDRLAEACDWDPFAFESVHRTEHSIEFQAVMLARLYGTQVRIVPILCSQLALDPHAEPGESGPVQRFLDALRVQLGDMGETVSVIAGADLAHVGKRFGDPFDIDAAIVESVRARDEEDLAFVSAPGANAFYRSVMKDQNARRVCGLGCIYATLSALEGRSAKGKRLAYDYAPDPAGGIVSFAACALT